MDAAGGAKFNERSRCPSVAIVSYDLGLIALVRDATARHAGEVEAFVSLAEVSVKGRVPTLDLLILDTDSYPITAEEIFDRIESHTLRPSVLLVGNHGLSTTESLRMPACVKRIVDRDSGCFALVRGIQDLLNQAHRVP